MDAPLLLLPGGPGARVVVVAGVVRGHQLWLGLLLLLLVLLVLVMLLLLLLLV